MINIKSKIGVVKRGFSELIGGQTVTFKKGEMVWISDFDHLGMGAICKHDKPFVTYTSKYWVEEFFIEWKRIR